MDSLLMHRALALDRCVVVGITFGARNQDDVSHWLGFPSGWSLLDRGVRPIDQAWGSDWFYHPLAGHWETLDQISRVFSWDLSSWWILRP